MPELFKLPKITRITRQVDGAYVPDNYGQPSFPNFQILENGFVDATVLKSLVRLVEGPISSWEDIRNAELALRATIFHDRVSTIRPEYHVFRISDANQKTNLGTYNSEALEKFRHGTVDGEEVVGESFGDLSSIERLLSDASVRDFHSITDERLATFSSDSVREEHLKIRESAEANAEPSMRRGEYSKLPNGDYPYTEYPTGLGGSIGESLASHGGVPGYSMLPSAGMPTMLHPSEEDYFEGVGYQSEERIRRFVAELSTTSSAIYLGHPASRMAHDVHTLNLGGGFFAALDIEWNQAFESMARNGLSVSLPPLVSIVLNRAANRGEIIPKAIELRSVFQEPRRQLWSLFEEALRAPSLSIQQGLLAKIEKDASEIVKRGLEARGFWPADLLRNGLRFVVNGMLGTVKWTQQIEGIDPKRGLRALENQLNYLDAARVVASELSNSDSMVRVLTKHLSEAEQQALGVNPAVTKFFDAPPK